MKNYGKVENRNKHQEKKSEKYNKFCQKGKDTKKSIERNEEVGQ